MRLEELVHSDGYFGFLEDGVVPACTKISKESNERRSANEPIRDLEIDRLEDPRPCFQISQPQPREHRSEEGGRRRERRRKMGESEDVVLHGATRV